MRSLQKYSRVFTLAATHTLKNYKALIGLNIFLVTCLLIFSHIWEIAAAKLGAVKFEPAQLLWYIAFNEWVLISLPDMHEDMEQDLRSGRLAYLLPRPVSYLFSVFFEGLGILSVNLLVLGFFAFSFTWLKSGVMPLSAPAFLIMIAIGFLAGCVGLVFYMLIGISAFWIKQVASFHWIFEKLLFTLGGLMLPLAVYPQWLQKIAYFTPFPSLLGDRSELAIHFSFQDALTSAGTLLFWGASGFIALLFLYRKGLRIVNIEGG